MSSQNKTSPTNQVNKIFNIEVQQKPTGKQIIFDFDKQDGGIQRVFKDEDRQESIKVEKHFSYFEMLNKMKQEVFVMFEPMRLRMKEIDDYNRKNQFDLSNMKIITS